MTTYTINYQTGITEEVQGTLEKAKQAAIDGMEYTQENVLIQLEGETVTTSRWYGTEPEDDDSVLVQYADYGFYQTWDDELN